MRERDLGSFNPEELRQNLTNERKLLIHAFAVGTAMSALGLAIAASEPELQEARNLGIALVFSSLYPANMMRVKIANIRTLLSKTPSDNTLQEGEQP